MPCQSVKQRCCYLAEIQVGSRLFLISCIRTVNKFQVGDLLHPGLANINSQMNVLSRI